MANLEENVKLKEEFNQVCVWEGTVLGDNTPEDFEKFILSEFNVRAQFLEEIATGPDYERGRQVPDTGGRADLFFVIHGNDIDKFAVPRFGIGARWIEDVLAECNYRSSIYPERVFDYCAWNLENLSKKRRPRK